MGGPKRSESTKTQRGNGDSGAVRADIWLWAVRMFRTRALAKKACTAGLIHINGVSAKPASAIRLNDMVEVRRGGWNHDLLVLVVQQKRVSASLARGCYLDRSPRPESSETDVVSTGFVRERGQGRPTKKDRRALDRLRRRSET